MKPPAYRERHRSQFRAHVYQTVGDVDIKIIELASTPKRGGINRPGASYMLASLPDILNPQPREPLCPLGGLGGLPAVNGSPCRVRKGWNSPSLSYYFQASSPGPCPARNHRKEGHAGKPETTDMTHFRGVVSVWDFSLRLHSLWTQG